MKVAVNGVGNIGTSILNLLVKYKSEIGIDEIYAFKNSIHNWNQVELAFLENQGVIICSDSPNSEFPSIDPVLSQIDYLFEATSNGIGMSNFDKYLRFENLKCSAQGSEKGFGKPYMSGINDEVIRNQKFVNVVSCNTHGTASLLTLFSGPKLENLAKADVVVVRRSEDLGNHERLVSANVVARHLDSQIGTHHAIDVVDMFKTLNINCELTSSDITTPSQLMHSVRFNIELKKELEEDIEDLIKANPFISTTNKFDSNVIFELGRRYGFQGRIFSHAILVSGNMLLDGKTIKGWAFVPQEGNSILSTLNAFLLQMNLTNSETLMNKIKKDLLFQSW